MPPRRKSTMLVSSLHKAIFLTTDAIAEVELELNEEGEGEV